MKKIPPRLLIIVALVLSILAAFLTYSMLSKSVKSQKSQEITVSVVIAKDTIGQETVIKEDMLKLVELPKSAVQADAYKDIKEVVGKKTRQSINAGDQLTRRRFTVVPNSGLQVSIPKDKRAVTIAVDEVSSIAGFVKPGQYVDIINVVGRGNNMPTMGKMILQNVLVLGTGQRDISMSGSNKAEKISTVTLAVDPRDAVKLRVAQQEGGKISLALRPLKPEEEEVMGSLVIGSGAAQVPVTQAAPAAIPNVAPKAPVTVIRGSGITK